MSETTLSIDRPHPWLLSSLILAAIASISCASIFIRLASAPPLAIAAYRVTLAALLIAPYVSLRTGSPKHAWDQRTLKLTLLAGFFLAFHFVFWITSLGLTSVASSATLVSTTPLFTALCAYVGFREIPSRQLKWGIVLTLLGSGLVAGTDFSFSQKALLGDGLALLGAIMAAGYLLAGRLVRRSLDLPRYTLGAYGTASFILLVCCLFTRTPLWGFSPATYLMLVLLALVPQLIGHTTFNWALKFLSPTTVAALILGEPIGATLLAYLILGETISPLKGWGLLILGAGIFLSAQTSPKACEASPPSQEPQP